MSTTRFIAAIVLVAALMASVAGVYGCATPTLPLPPPSALTAGPPDADGWVTVSGDVLPEAYVFCLNLDTDRGVIVRADPAGAFTLQIEASAGDYLSIFQESGADRGPPFEIRVPMP